MMLLLMYPCFEQFRNCQNIMLIESCEVFSRCFKRAVACAIPTNAVFFRSRFLLKFVRSFFGSWQVPNSLISLVSSVLRKGEDDMTQLYALRTIENICSQGGHWAARFTSQDVISNLCYIYRAAGKQESMRLTAGSCLVRLVRFNPQSIQSVIDRFSLKDIASTLSKGSLREQQISLNLLNLAFLGSHLFSNIGRYLLPLVEDRNLVPSLLSLIEQGSEVLRGKALVFVALLCKNGKRWLPQFFGMQGYSPQ